MPVKNDNYPEQELPDTHYHVIRSGWQFVVMRHSHAWHPPTDVMADDDRLVVVIEVAGMKAGEFHVTFADQHLTVTGTRTSTEEQHAAYYQLEVRYGDFRTDIDLPWPINEDEIAAEYEDGFLRIELPRAKAHKVRVVDVKKNEP